MMALRRPSARTTLTILFVLIGAAWSGFLGLRHLAARASALDELENLSLEPTIKHLTPAAERRWF
jgi:hypothetical protein